MTAPTHPYAPGDVLRVTADHPVGTKLQTGDLVTVTACLMADLSGLLVPVVRVTNGSSTYALPLPVVEKADPDPYSPADPDEVVDAIFERIVADEPELAAVFTELHAEMDAAADPLAAGRAKTNGAMEMADPVSFTDENDDTLAVHFFQGSSGDLLEAGFLFQLNDQWVKVPVQKMTDLVRYLNEGVRRASRKPGDPA